MSETSKTNAQNSTKDNILSAIGSTQPQHSEEEQAHDAEGELQAASAKGNGEGSYDSVGGGAHDAIGAVL